MSNLQVPAWGTWVMLVGFVAFLVLLVIYFKRNHGLKRPIFSSPYTLWIIVFTIVPCLLIAYYAFTDVNGAFTLDNFKNFWDSNYDMNKERKAATVHSATALPLILYPAVLKSSPIKL